MSQFSETCSLVGTRLAASRKLLVRILPLVLIASVQAWATLGADVSTVQADQAEMKASLKVTPSAAYTVHEMKVESGMVVREFVSPAGKVFGVAWQGPGLPNMRQVLGTYFDRYVQAQQNRKFRRAPIVINDSNLVFQMTGHTRSFSGTAYVPQMMPQGVRADEIR